MSVILLTITTNEAEAKLTTDNKVPVYLKEQEYSDEAYAKIRREADVWNIQIRNSYGEDYGYGRESSTIVYMHREIDEECMIVEDGHFAGVLMQSSGTSFNKSLTVYKDLTAALVKDWEKEEGVFCARQGDSFSSDDHEKWDIYSYFLTKKEHNKK